MYLVPAEEYRNQAKRGRRRTKQHPHTEWINLRSKHRCDDLQRKAQTKDIADYMIQIMPVATISKTLTPDTVLPKLKVKSRRVTQTDVTSDSVSNIRPSKRLYT